MYMQKTKITDVVMCNKKKQFQSKSPNNINISLDERIIARTNNSRTKQTNGKHREINLLISDNKYMD